MGIFDLIATALHVSPEQLRVFLAQSSYKYKRYTIKKHSGGERVIYHPARQLKMLQRIIINKVFNYLPISDFAYAYRHGRSIRDNANIHCANRYLLRMDFKNFFESITASHIKSLLLSYANLIPNFDPEIDIPWIIRIACRGDSITVGAPSSPIISNCIMFSFDQHMDGVCRQHGCVYTRYADDLFFSTNTPWVLQSIEDEVMRYLSCEPIYTGMNINFKKTVRASTRGFRAVTGIVLTPTKVVSLGREKKRLISCRIHQFVKGSLPPLEFAKLSGQIAYARSIEPSFVDSMKRKYGEEVLENLLSHRWFAHR